MIAAVMRAILSYCEKKLEKEAISELENSHFQNETKCKTFLVKMSFIYLRIKNKSIFISKATPLASL